MSHCCHAAECAHAVPPRMLMCRRHWRLVPAQLQRAVWRAYVPGQEWRKDPTPLYLLVQRLAVGVVALSEGTWSAEHAQYEQRRAHELWSDRLGEEEAALYRGLLTDLLEDA